MKHVLFVIILFLYNYSYTQSINDYIANISLDSLVSHVRALSGEDSTYVYGEKVLIEHRRSPWGNDLSANYIKERLENYNLQVDEQICAASAINILGTQLGETYPDSIIIICAHYDSFGYYAADDNASACASLLEAARIFSGQCFEYTIVYAFWDEEEYGFIGSEFFAQQMSNNGDPIVGVFNVDMMAYDSNDDMLFDVYVNTDPKSIALKDSLINFIYDYNLQLIPYFHPNLVTSTDHVSFWNHNYPAVGFGEAFYGGDYNPAYHTIDDRIDLFNLPYYLELSKLLIGITAQSALPCSDTYSEEKIKSNVIAEVFPNPTQKYINIVLPEKETFELTVTDVTGKKMISLYSKEKITSVDLSHFKAGVYLFSISNSKTTQISRVIKY